MKVYAPKYYKDFKCIADKCTHSCCVQWQIYVDKETSAWHKSSSHPISRELVGYLCEDGDGEYIALTESGKCPFLDGCGLCRIHSAVGDEKTSRICREHPRFYHRISDVYEMGIGAVCEVAARLILDSDISDIELSLEREIEEIDKPKYDAYTERESIFRVIRESGSLAEILDFLMKKYEISPEIFSDEELKNTISDLELLDDKNRKILLKTDIKAVKCKEEFAKRFLFYLIFRHVSTARDYEDLRSSVAFSIALTNILTSANDRSVYDVARMISEEIEYSEDNVSALKFSLFCLI